MRVTTEDCCGLAHRNQTSSGGGVYSSTGLNSCLVLAMVGHRGSFLALFATLCFFLQLQTDIVGNLLTENE